MNEEELWRILETAPWMPCEFCKELMPFEILEIPNIGQGAACMNCGTPSTDTMEAIAQFEENLEILAEVSAMIATIGTTLEEVQKWEQEQINNVRNVDNDQVSSAMESIESSSDIMYNDVASMSDADFSKWITGQQVSADSPDSTH